MANGTSPALGSSFSGLSQNKATPNQISAPQCKPNALVSNLETESAIQLSPSSKVNSQYRISHSEKKSNMEFWKVQNPQTLKHRHSGSSLMPLHCNTLGTDYSETLFGWWHTAHSGDPASWELSNLRAAHSSVQRQRKSQKWKLMTDLKQFKTVTNLNWFVKIFISENTHPSYLHQQFVPLWATLKVHSASFSGNLLNYLAYNENLSKVLEARRAEGTKWVFARNWNSGLDW